MRRLKAEEEKPEEMETASHLLFAEKVESSESQKTPDDKSRIPLSSSIEGLWLSIGTLFAKGCGSTKQAKQLEI
jgi:hypothetical protein